MEFKEYLAFEHIFKTVIWPGYVKYCEISGIKPVSISSVKQVPALLNKNFGVTEATSNRQKARKNQPTQKHTAK